MTLKQRKQGGETKDRKRPPLRPSCVRQGEAVIKRLTWGSTEKIRRRNRKLFMRLASRARRALDKQRIREDLPEAV